MLKRRLSKVPDAKPTYEKYCQEDDLVKIDQCELTPYIFQKPRSNRMDLTRKSLIGSSNTS